ncbi:MAG TPA: hypothetical protein VFQ12_11760 [Thermoleophilaceae bacterium]|nr:hypothetical protein [Thermoleophilaceae bacterium]
MSTTTEATPTADELRNRLAKQQAEVEAAHAALGAAALDSPNPKTASKRLTDAEAAVQRTKAAVAELERREAERGRHELELTAARDRMRTYVFAADYMEACIEVQRLQEQVRAAGDRLGEIARGVTRATGQVKSPGLGRPLPWDISTMDEDLIRGLPDSRSMGPGRGSRFPIGGPDDVPEFGKWRAGPEVLEQRADRARELAAKEAEKVAALEKGGR